MASFDVDRAIIRPEPICPPLTNPRTYPLAQAVLADAENVLVAEVAGELLILRTVDMVYYHVAQGVVANHPWLVSFCMICNAGACFSPVVEGSVHTFTEKGLYDAMTLLSDTQTASIWHHITGECLYGPWQGKQLVRLSTLHHTTASQAKIAYPDAHFVEGQLSTAELAEAQDWDALRRNDHITYPPHWAGTMGQEDDRLARLTAGLGVWGAGYARFYPLTAINAANNLIIDTLAGQPILIYINPESDMPHAFWLTTPVAQWRGARILLDDGLHISHDVCYTRTGERHTLARPLQLFQRWYSFAYLFPTCDIYGD